MRKTMTAALFFLLCAGGVRAQEEGGDRDRKVAFHFEGASIQNVLEYVSKEMGVTFVQQFDVRGTVTAISAEPIPESQVLDFLDTVLLPLGASTVRNGMVIKVVALDDAKRINQEIRVGRNPDEIEMSDRIITQIVPIHYASAEELQKELGPILPKTMKMIVNIRSNSLVMTDTSANIRRVVRIVSALDTELMGVVQLKVYRLEHSDATDLAEVVNDIFEVSPKTQEQGDFRGRLMRLFGGGGGEERKPTEEITGERREVRASADERTNSLIVTASEEYIGVVDTLVEQLDADDSEKESTMVYPLRNADSANLEKTLTDLFSQASGQAAQGNRQRGREQAAEGGGGPGGFMRQSFLAGMAQSDAGEGLGLVGEVNVKAEKDTNSLIIVSSSRNFPMIRTLLDQIDQERAQVLIKVLIAEVTLDNTLEFGVEGTWENSADVQSATTDFDLAARGIGFKYRIAGEEIDATLHMLKEEGKLRVLSTPRILVLDNEKATINVGQRVPFVTNTRLTDQGTTMNTIQYEDVGIKLEVTPHINPDGLVKMLVKPEVSQVAPESAAVMITEGVTSPVFQSTTASTTVTVLNGQTAILGGLIRESDNTTVSKVPFLGDIPLINLFFRFENQTKQQTELMIFLTPYVSRNREALRELSETERTNLRLIDDSVIRTEAMEWRAKRRN